MKNAVYLIGLLLVPVVLLGQKPIEVSGTSFKLGQDEYSGVQVMIPEAGFEQVEKMWIKTIEKGTKSDVSEELYESEFNQLKAYMHDFGKEAYIEEVEEQLEAEENVLKELEKELKSLQHDKESMEKKISKNEHNIMVSDDDIRILDADIAIKNEELARAKVRLGSVGDNPVQRETIEAEIKDLEKEKKNIVGYNSDIDNIELEIPALVEQQNRKMQEIEQQ